MQPAACTHPPSGHCRQDCSGGSSTEPQESSKQLLLVAISAAALKNGHAHTSCTHKPGPAPGILLRCPCMLRKGSRRGPLVCMTKKSLMRWPPHAACAGEQCCCAQWLLQQWPARRHHRSGSCRMRRSSRCRLPASSRSPCRRTRKSTAWGRKVRRAKKVALNLCTAGGQQPPKQQCFLLSSVSPWRAG